MTFNWGHKLIGAFLAFGAMTSYMVYRTTTANIDLVSNEYYKDEVAYQQVIDGTNLANRLSAPVQVRQEGSDIVIQFPGEMKHTPVKGEALFYCAVDARRDKTIPLQLSDNAEQHVASGQFVPGRYMVKFSWTSGNREYHSQQPVQIQ